ncbi:MAG: hypothetical protein JNK43_08885, partial [Ignavibacteria bacterium]|nr:hypothetical protein [Ignavibacteria bacterium]
MAQNIFSQSGKVVVRLKKPPPMSFLTEDLFKLTIINPTQETYRVYLHGNSSEAIVGLVMDASCGTFDLPPGVKNVQTSDIGKVTINQKNEKYKDVITRMGQLPTGDYDICVDVVDAATGNILGTDCISHEVLLISQLMLVSPGDNSVIGSMSDDDPSNKPPKIKPGFWPRSSENEILAGSEIEFYDTIRVKLKRPPLQEKINTQQPSSQIIFTWLPPVPVPRGYSVTYKLKIAEIIGMQSAYDAMQSNPLFFSHSSIVSTSYQYPLAARSFTAGRKYAWQIQAFVNGVLLSESEVWSLRYGQNTASYRLPPLKPPIYNWILTAASENQKKRNPFIFSFSSELFGESSNRSGTGSDKEPRYGFLNLTPSVSLYGLPFSTSILLSSENSASRQNINSMGLRLDAETIKEFIMEKVESEKNKILSEGNKDESKLSSKQKDKLESDAKSKVMSKLNPALKLISSFKTLGIGTTYPSYTPFTMQGVPVSGLNVEFNPGWFYIAATAQKNQKPIDNSAFRRDLYAGRIGYGQTDKSHIYLTGFYANDKAGSIIVDSTNQRLTPNTNYLFGIQGKLNLFRDKLSFEAEAVGSMLTRDNRDADLENNSIPSFVKNMFHPKISSQVDYSYTIKSIFDNQNSNTKVTASLKMVGPGFVTLGNPTLRGDKLEVETKITQKFINKQVSVTASLKWFKDNLINSKS